MKSKNIKEIILNIFSIIFISGGLAIAFDNTVIKILTRYPDKNNLIGIIIFLIGIGFFMGFYYLVNNRPKQEPTKDIKERHQEIIKSDKECSNCVLYQRENIKQEMKLEDKPEEEIRETLKYLDEVIDEKYR